jgi:hypothetical protein
MFKKLAIIIILVVYGLSSTGAIVHLDYCCGKLSNISLSPVKNKKDNCHKDKMDGKSCCDSKQLSLSIKGEQETLQKAANFSPISLPALSIQEVYYFFNNEREVKSFSNGPPLIFSSPPLFVQNCNFRI